VKRITILGNFSGRNLGDNAILGNAMDDLAAVDEDLEFIVPTLRASYVRDTFSHHRVKALGLMPWNLSLKILGVPTWRAMRETDAILITDNILFDRQFFNPAFNYLSTISLFAPEARRRGIPIILYNASVGPINTTRGEAALRRVLGGSPLGIVRDPSSLELVKALGLPGLEMVMGADCALNTQPLTSEQLDALIQRVDFPDGSRPILGLNINAYIDAWSPKDRGVDRNRFVGLVARVTDRLIADLGVDVAIVATQVMDRAICESLRQSLSQRDRVHLVSNPDIDYPEAAALLGRADLVIAMRTHAMILACAAGTPVVNLNAYPKSRAFLETLDLNAWTLELPDLTEDVLYDRACRAWEARAETRKRVLEAVKAEKVTARSAAEQVLGLLREPTHATA
jgi:polysaccharide pyruvyl transferase WcaK-like protein